MPQTILRRLNAPDRPIFYAITLLVLCVCLAIGGNEIRPSDDWLHRMGTWAIALVFPAICAIYPVFCLPSLELLTDGVQYRTLLWSRTVSWGEVTSVHCCDVSSRQFIGREYRLFVAVGDNVARLTLRGDYDGIEDVLETLQAEMTARGVPVYVRKNGWPALTDRIPSPDEAPRSMWSLQ